LFVPPSIHHAPSQPTTVFADVTTTRDLAPSEFANSTRYLPHTGPALPIHVKPQSGCVNNPRTLDSHQQQSGRLRGRQHPKLSFGRRAPPSILGQLLKVDYGLSLNIGSLAPAIDATAVPTKSAFAGSKPSASALTGLAGARVGASSPLLDQGPRLLPKRARELQSSNGLASNNIWGPPTTKSGASTPLFEIPESPSQDGFPDLLPLTESGINSPARRGRAGTLPSRISPATTLNGTSLAQNTSKTSRPTPSTSPFRPASAAETAFNNASSASSVSNPAAAAILSRLRAGSMPQRASILSQSSVFVGSSWSSRSRAATLTSIQSAEDPVSPLQPSLSRDSMTDTGVRTLDYLGLAETPQPGRAEPLRSVEDSLIDVTPGRAPDPLSSFNLRNANRFRSFSVNTQQPQYGLDGLENGSSGFPLFQNGQLTPSAAAALEAEYEAVQEKVRLHNQAVQAFAVNASVARPRARTAGIVETPKRKSLRTVDQANQGGSPTPQETQSTQSTGPGDFADVMQRLTVAEHPVSQLETIDDSDMHMSRSLWIGSIPNSTTMSSLDAIFSHYGAIESTRVLTHKNCGFVNFENLEDAVRAKQMLNGKEIFPGSGPVRIGFAKAPTASNSHTPNEHPASSQNAAAPLIDRLQDLQPEILQIVIEFGAQSHELPIIASMIQSAASYRQLETEIPPIPEPSPNRSYDAPRLRDIRKRIDNGTCSLQEIEQVAIDMLPEIAELSSDYLGNTVVQKLFEFCSEQVKEQMLIQIAPHLAEIGVHKNGTWAAQKIIDVCKTDTQTQIVVQSLRPYTVPLFLDQYGNYVLQCCLRFGPPYSDFIFETILSQIGEISQGRFGARATRACLESHHATKHQQRLMAAAITIASVQLATNANGALLLTWLLDTCTFPRRRSVLAPRLVPQLVSLGTHKVAYLTILKVVNQRNEPEARDTILKALFFTPGNQVLEQVLSDHASGVTLIFKILTTPFLDDATRPDVVRNITTVLGQIRAQPDQGYKRLMDEVGMSSRSTQPPVQQYSHAHPPMPDRGRPAAQPPLLSQPSAYQREYSGSYVHPLNTTGLETSPVRSASADSFGYSPYAMNAFTSQPNYGNLQYQQMTPQPQYPNYPSHGQRANGHTYMANGYNGYATPPSSVDVFRMQNQAASPIPYSAQMSPVMSSGGMMPPGFSQPANLYQYPQHPFIYSPQMQPVQAASRGRRMGRFGA
ncbi:hypothetical protein DV736_g573, partial [Chaetothyriales sp. CBS 134916]